MMPPAISETTTKVLQRSCDVACSRGGWSRYGGVDMAAARRDVEHAPVLLRRGQFDQPLQALAFGVRLGGEVMRGSLAELLLNESFGHRLNSSFRIGEGGYSAAQNSSLVVLPVFFVELVIAVARAVEHQRHQPAADEERKDDAAGDLGDDDEGPPAVV